MTLDADLIERYRRDGVVAIRGALSAEWIAKLEAGLERNIREPGPHRREYTQAGNPGHFFGDYCNWRRIPEYEAIARRSPLVEMAAALMGGGKVNFFHEHVLVKEPGTPERTPWHHDQPYYCVDGDQNVSFWCPLDPVPEARAVEFIAGSHRWNRLFVPTRFIGTDYARDEPGFETMPDIEAERDQHRMLRFALAPGDCAAFHFRTVHGAPGNTSAERRRRAVTFRYTGADARFVLRQREMSPPFTTFPDFAEQGLQPGDALDSALFPVVRS